MVIVVGPAETAESVRELNFRHEFEIEEIHGSGVSTVLHQLEQGAEHITHLVYDVRIIGNIDASLALLDRLCKTIPGISEKTIVVAANLGENSPFLRDICELVPQDHVVQDPAAELKRVLNTMLCADGIIRAEAEPEPQEAPVAAAAEPVPEPQEPPPPPAPIEVTPPSQVGRTAAQAQLVLPKPKIERSATCIAVAGAGHRIGATTQAMQICLYVKALGYKAAVIEMAASALTGYTQISDEAVLFDEHHFRVEGTDIYNDRTCILDGKSQYDYLILDYGCFSDLTEPADYLRNDILVAVCGAKPSEVELAADVLRVDNGTIHYIFSFVPQRDRPDVLASMEQYGERTYFADWTPDYFLYSGNDNLYGKITGQIQGNKTVQKKSTSTSGFGGENENRCKEETHAYGSHQRGAAAGTVEGSLWYYGKGQGCREKIPDRADAPRTDQRRVCGRAVRGATCNRRAGHHRAGNADLSQYAGCGAGNVAGDRATAC